MPRKEKRDTSTGSVSKASLLNLRCGDCLHFKGTPHPAIGSPCSSLGVKAYATAPPCYTANISVFRKIGPDVFATLSGILSTFTPQQSRVLMGLLKSAGSLEKHGYTFAQKVYFRVGEDYLDNYFSGHVLGVGLENSLMIVGLSYFTTAKSQVTASVFKSSVMSEEAFIKKRKKLVASGLLYAPRVAKKNVIKDAATYEPPTLETSQELLEQLANKERKKRPTRSGGPASTLEVNLRGDRQQRSKKARDDLDDSDDDEDYGASDEDEGYTV